MSFISTQCMLNAKTTLLHSPPHPCQLHSAISLSEHQRPDTYPPGRRLGNLSAQEEKLKILTVEAPQQQTRQVLCRVRLKVN